MQLSLNWLKDYVHIPKAVTAEELAAKLTLHTVEVESIAKQADKFKNVVVGKILKVEKHPNADRLRLTKVDIGQEVLPIVCGADNIQTGQYVPVALAGAILPNGLEIKEAEVRGEISKGMLCAEDELGLGKDHSGIMILGKAKLGTDLAQYLKLSDTILEVDNKSITNRPDLWSHLGMARDISAILKAKLTPKALTVLASALPASSAEEARIDAKVDDHELCPRYMAVALKGVRVAPSPEWLKERITAAGMRPINNIVDITNFVMLELGQPMHAFDLRKIAVDPADGAQRIVVRLAQASEPFETLDLVKRELEPPMLMIADQSQPLAVAGVMGGAESEIEQDTEAVLFESANFQAVSIRKTSDKLGLRTESSIRFEKSLDTNLCEIALARAVQLVMEICPGSRIDSRIVDTRQVKPEARLLEVGISWLKERIGTEIETREIVSILERLGFSVQRDRNALSLIVPSWRFKDIIIPEDVLEEIIRIHGYDNVKPQMPNVVLAAVPANLRLALKRLLKDCLVHGAGFSETYNYSFLGEDQLKKLKIDPNSHLRLHNPLASHQNILRQSLAPNLFECVKKNQARCEEVRLFEIGSVYCTTLGNMPVDSSGSGFLPFQEERLGLVMAGSDGFQLFAEMKGALTVLSEELGLSVEFERTDMSEPWSDASARANVIIGGKLAGSVMRLDPKLGRSAGIKKETVLAELNLNVLEECAGIASKSFKEFEKFPPVIRDLAFVMDDKVIYSDFRKSIQGFSEMVKVVVLFDVYAGDKVGHGKKSLAFHIVWQSDRTLKSEEVDALQAGLVKLMEEKYGAKVRDF